MPGFYRSPHYKKRKFQKNPYAKAVTSTRAYQNAKITRNPPRFGMPQEHVTKMRYAERFAITVPASGGLSIINMVANGAYDPNLTGVGHQPRGFDQVHEFYYHNTVLYSKISMNVSSTLSNHNFYAFITCKGATTNLGLNDIDENTYTVSKLYNRSAGALAPISTGMNVSKFLGIPNLRNYAAARGSQAANPSEAAYYQCSFMNPDTTDLETYSIEVFITIDYTIVFGEPQPVAQS